MSYGEIKIDTITFTAGGVDTSIAVSGLVQNPTFTGNITTTGTISGDIIRGNTISGVTVTGGAGEFGSLTAVSGVFTTQVSGATVTGNVGLFTTITGGTVNLTSGIFASGTAAAPSVSIGTTDNGLYSPGADQVAISTNGTGRLFVDSSGNININNSSQIGVARFGIKANAATENAIAIQTSTDGILAVLRGLNAAGTEVASIHYDTANSAIIARTGNAEKLRIDSSGRLGIGISSPSDRLHVNGGDIRITDTFPSLVLEGTTGGQTWSLIETLTGDLETRLNNNPVHVIDTSGRVGIGTTPAYALDVATASNLSFRTKNTDIGSALQAQFHNDSDLGATIVTYGSAYPAGSFLNVGANGSAVNVSRALGINVGSTYTLRFGVGNIERARIDSSGRLLVGTSTAIATSNYGYSGAGQFQVGATGGALAILQAWSFNNNAGDYPSILDLGRSRGTQASPTTVAPDDRLGIVNFVGYNGTNYYRGASIYAEVDAAISGNEMPGRLVFSTTADGASSPTERMRIASDGLTLIGKTASAIGTAGTEIGGGAIWTTRSANTAMRVNRLTDDGTLVEFLQASVAEGTISVSGTTVSYNGAHLSRWSQLPSGQERTEILRGTVLSNINEMCEWGEEENEQLNRMKVSDVEGDKNVSGVFQAWDDDDDTYTDDFYCAMTGDFIIRIAQGVTVERGDLLMSAGDGTAKPQDDDIIRSKTIAKVTSTNVTCTYEDGSYCVPCVLMAC